MDSFNGYMKGINLGGWLSQCDHSEERYAGFITERDFEILAGWGIDHVRVPVDYDLVETKDGDLKESGFAHIQDAIDWAGNYRLNMILDLHKTFGYSFDDGEQEAGFFENTAYQERFYRLWEQFAERFGKFKDRLAFELLNEVTDRAYCDVWNQIADQCIKRIRKIAPDINILIGGYYNNSVTAVKDLLPPADEHIIYNFHCYDPLIFTHQGAYWIPSMKKDLQISVRSTYAALREASEQSLLPVPPESSRFDKDDRLGPAYFEALFEEAVQVAQERNVRLYCGEYGVIDRASADDVLLWYEWIHAAFEKYGIGRAAWSYKEMDFGLSDSRLDTQRERLLTLL